MLDTTNEMISNPTATVTVDGLSVFCHNQNDACVDFGFLRAISSNHPYRIKIYNFGGIFWSSEDQPGNPLENSIITIRKSTPRGVNCYRHPNGKQNDPRDFGWILNLSSDLYNDANITFRTPTIANLFAKLSIKDAAFYTKLKSVNMATITEANSGALHFQRELGRVIGADILCEQNENIVLEISRANNLAPPDTLVTLPKDQGPYWISVDYKCVPSCHDDFPHIYDVINVPDNIRYNLRYTPSEEDWTFRGIIGNRATKRYIDECEIPGHEPDFPHDKRVYFNTALEARNAGYNPHLNKRIEVTEYACQSSDSGGTGGVPFPDV